MQFTLALADLSTNRGGGAVGHTFTPRAILDALIFNHHLKPSSTMKAALADSARLMLGDGGTAVAQRIEDGRYALPSIGLLREGRQRLDVCQIVFQQRAWLRTRAVFYQCIDSSPQMGYNILCCIHDTVVLPEPQSVAVCGLLLGMADYTSFICPLSSLARGHTGLIKKSTNAVNVLLMHSEDEDDFDRKRKQFRGNTSDQGTEIGTGDMSVSIVKNYSKNISPGSNDSFLYPNLLTMPGFLHILFDGLEETVTKHPMNKEFLDVLETTQSFLNDKSIVDKFRKDCLVPGSPEDKLFQTGQRRHCDWKWDYLCGALADQIPKFEVLEAKLDVSKVLASTSGEKLSSKVLVAMKKATEYKDFIPLAHANQAAGILIESAAGKLEICDCHAFLWTPTSTRKRRLAEIKRLTGHEKCIWQGRRLAWWIATGKAEFFESLRCSEPVRLREYLDEVNPARRARVVQMLGDLRRALLEIYVDKFSFLDHTPYVAIGGFYVAQGGNEVASRSCLQLAFNEYDKAMAEGKGDKLHRVAHKLCGQGAGVHVLLELFEAVAQSPLRSF